MEKNIKIDKNKVKTAIANKKKNDFKNHNKNIKDKPKEEKVKNSLDKQDWRKTYNYRPFSVLCKKEEESKSE